MLIAVTIIYIMIIKEMVFDYVELVGRKMTVKERAARQRTSKNMNLKDEHDCKKQPVPFKLRLKRMWRFFVTTKAPPSIIKAK